MPPSLPSRTRIYRHHHLDSTRWDAVGFDAMRSDGARLLGPMDRFAGGPNSFLYKGTNGRWRAALTPADLGLYDSVASGLDPRLRAWLEGGRKGE